MLSIPDLVSLLWTVLIMVVGLVLVPMVRASVLVMVVTPMVMTARPVSPVTPFELSGLMQAVAVFIRSSMLWQWLKILCLLLITTVSALVTVFGLLLDIGVLSTVILVLVKVLLILWVTRGVTESTLTRASFLRVFLTSLLVFRVVLWMRGEPGSTATISLDVVVILWGAVVIEVLVVVSLRLVLGSVPCMMRLRFVPSRPRVTGPFTTLSLMNLTPTASSA